MSDVRNDKVILWGFCPRTGEHVFGLVDWHYKKAQDKAAGKTPLLLTESQLDFGNHQDARYNSMFGYSGLYANKEWADSSLCVLLRKVDISLFKLYESVILSPDMVVTFENVQALKLKAGLVNGQGSTSFNPELGALVAFIEAFALGK